MGGKRRLTKALSRKKQTGEAASDFSSSVCRGLFKSYYSVFTLYMKTVTSRALVTERVDSPESDSFKDEGTFFNFFRKEPPLAF